MHEDLDMEASVEELNALEEKFTNIVKERVAGNPELKFVFLVSSTKATLISFLLMNSDLRCRCSGSRGMRPTWKTRWNGKTWRTL